MKVYLRIGFKTLIYTNEVFGKERISKENNINILDIHDLQKLAYKYSRYGELMDFVIQNTK